MSFSPPLITLPLVLSLFIVGCASQVKPAEVNPTDMPKGPGLFSGESGNILEAFKSKDSENGGNTGLGVNTYLWRASLESLSFMPITTADSAGGVIATDWYTTNAATANERMRANVLILGKKLQASALQVKLFKQVKEKGGWADAPVSAETTRALEDTILTKARALRVRELATQKK
jgi:Domain of unknown function (DUF3576)